VKPYNSKPYNRKSLMVAGAACILIAVSEISRNGMSSGIFWIVLGVCVFLWASRVKDEGDSKNGAPGGFFKIWPGEGSSDQPEQPEQTEPVRKTPDRDASWDNTPYAEEPEATAGLGDDRKRRDEIKSLFDSGVITREEYEERLSQIKKD